MQTGSQMIPLSTGTLPHPAVSQTSRGFYPQPSDGTFFGNKRQQQTYNENYQTPLFRNGRSTNHLNDSRHSSGKNGRHFSRIVFHLQFTIIHRRMGHGSSCIRHLYLQAEIAEKSVLSPAPSCIPRHSGRSLCHLPERQAGKHPSACRRPAFGFVCRVP